MLKKALNFNKQHKSKGLPMDLFCLPIVFDQTQLKILNSKIKLQNRMDTIFMNFGFCKMYDPHRLLIIRLDRINLKRSNKYIDLSYLLYLVYLLYIYDICYNVLYYYSGILQNYFEFIPAK